MKGLYLCWRDHNPLKAGNSPKERFMAGLFAVSTILKLEAGVGFVTPTNGPISEIQHGDCVVDSLEKVKYIAKAKYIETVCVLSLGVSEAEDSNRKLHSRQ